jgi:PAS domain S-box-containing protein
VDAPRRFTREDEAAVALEATDRALLDAVMRLSDVGVAVWDRELRYQRVNAALAAMSGLPAEEHIGRHVTEVLPGLGRELAPLLGRVMESDRPASDIEVSGETPAEPGRRRSWLATYYPLHDPDGAVVGAGVLLRDVTGRKRAEMVLARRERDASFLAEATATLAESLDFAATLRTAARLAVPRIADWCVVDVVRDGGGLRRIALAHTDRAKESLAWELTRRYPSGPGGLEGPPKTIRTATPELVPELRDSYLERIAQDDEHLSILRELGLRSLMTLPLRARGRTFGAMAFVSSSPGRRFDRHDLSLAESLATRAALAADNARLFGEREYIARALQRSLLPPRLPEVPGIELSARYRPAGDAGDVGGDFYDVFPTADGRWGLAIGDVSGKGPDAAAVTALARHTMHVAAAYEQRPSRVLAALNDALLEDQPRPLLTAAYARLSPGLPTGVEIAAGGHPLPLIVRAAGGVESAGHPGTLLGFAAVPNLVDSEHALEPGDAMVLFTDGVIESRPIERALGPAGLAELLSQCSGWTAEAIAELIEQAVEEHSEGRQNDDVAVLVLRVVPR